MNKISLPFGFFLGACLSTVMAQADISSNATPGVKSLSDIPQHLEGAGNVDPNADKSQPPLAVIGSEIKENLPEAGKYYRMTIHPGQGGYPGMTLGFDSLVDFSAHDVLAVWFKCDAPVSFFQIVPHGADGVMEEFGLSAARDAAFVKPGIWHLAFIPFKTDIGWVRNGKQMDWTKIKGISFYTDDAMLAPNRPQNFELGGMALYKLDEAKVRYTQTQIYPPIPTAAKIASGKDVSVWTADAGEKIFKDSPCPTDAPSAKAASAKAAGHEYASLQWVVKPSRDMKGLEADAGDLVGDKGRIPAANIKIRYVDYVEKLFFSAPDPLPLLNGKGLQAPKDQNLIVWATIYVPPGTPKGTYQGDIVLKDAEGLSQRLPVKLEVYGFDLPVQNHLKSLYTIEHLYGGSPAFVVRSLKHWGKNIPAYSEEYKTIINNAIRDFGEHRITPELFSGMEYLSHDDLVALQKKYGFDPVWSFGYNYVYQGYLDAESKPRAITPKERAENIDALKTAAQKFEAAGEINLTYIKIADEPDQAHLAPVVLAAQDAKAAIPDVQSFITVTTPDLPKSLYGLLNTWCPIWPRFDFESPQVRERKAAGDRFWTYASDYRSQDAYEPMDLRVIYWLYWKYGISGVHYSHNDPSIFLAYPNDTYMHSDGLEEIPSIRLEMMRQGIQDFEYLWMLGDLVEKSGGKGEAYRKLLEIPPKLAQDKINYTRDPTVLLKRRDQLARAIEELSRKQR